MKNINLNLTQNTALGNDQSEQTIVYVSRWTSDDTLALGIKAPSEDFAGVPSNAYETVATVTITHPWCMAGSAEDIECDFYRRANKALLEAGFAEENDSGLLFWIG